MSQNHISLIDPAGKTIHLVVGWDPPLQEYFCQAASSEVDEARGDRHTRSFQTLNALVVDLKSEMGLTLPRAVLDALAQDRNLDNGSAIRKFGEGGRLTEGVPRRSDA